MAENDEKDPVSEEKPASTDVDAGKVEEAVPGQEPAKEDPAPKAAAAKKRRKKKAVEREAVEAVETEAPATSEPTAEAAKSSKGEKVEDGANGTGGEEEDADDGFKKKWYVVHTYSGHENKVRENILKMINVAPIKEHFGQLVVPTEEVAEMKKGKKTITTKKFFPSYILIEMQMTDESWHLVNSIPGVTSFVGTGDKPQPLSKPEVERILGRMDKEKQTIIPEIPFTLGEHIRIKDGPFSDFTGVVDEINAEKGKLKVLVSIFGRETPVELDFLQVESV